MNPDIPEVIPRGSHFTIRYGNRHLYSPSSPYERAVEKAESVSIYPHTLVLLASPLLFYGVETLLNNLPEHCHLLCIESDSNLSKIDPKPEQMHILEDPGISYIKTRSPEEVVTASRSLGFWKFRRCVLISINGGYALHARHYRSIRDILQKEIELFWKNRMTLINMVPLWIKNLFHNLTRYPFSLDLRFVSTEKPIVVTGAGESLEETLHELRLKRKDVFILSVDTAIPVLLTSDIIPDAVVCLESQVTNLKDFIGSAGKHIRLFCDFLSHPSTYQATDGETAFFLSRFAPNLLFERMETAGLTPPFLPPLGSVGVAAVYIALRLTKNKIYVTGLDFSFTLGKTHSRGSPAHIAELTSWNRLQPTDSYGRCVDYQGYHRKDKSGRTIKTTLILESYRDQLEASAGKENRVYDLGLYGLPVKGIPRAELEIGQPYSEKKIQYNKLRVPESRKQVVRDFLMHEKSLLSRVYQTGNEYLSLHTERHRQKFTTSLEICDYLLLHFPDPERLDICDRSFTARVCAAADLYIRHIDYSLGNLSQCPKACC